MTPEQVDAFVATLPVTLDPDVRADVVSIVAYLKDPVIGLYVERTLRAAIDAGSWQAMLDALEPKTAEDFKALDKDALGHGSYKRGERGEFLLDHKDALANITAGKPATIAKEQLRDVLKLAEKRGGAPDLVKLTLEGTPLFAGGLNIARKDMPQISRDERPNLLASLKAQGVAVTKEQVAPMSLLPTQKEINAARVGGMLTKFESHNNPLNDILISKDNRVLDGHHRWALGVMLQTEAPGVKMRAIRIGVDHAKALSLLNTYTKDHHIAPQALEVRVAGGAGSGNFGHTGGEGGPGNPGGSGAGEDKHSSHSPKPPEHTLTGTDVESKQRLDHWYYGTNPNLAAGEFNPTQAYIDLYKSKVPLEGRGTAEQDNKLHEALRALDKALHDPAIGMELAHIIKTADPAGIRNRIYEMETGVQRTIIGGKDSAPKIFVTPSVRLNEASALAHLIAMLDDPLTGPFLVQFFTDVKAVGSWDALVAQLRAPQTLSGRMAGGSGSGNFGHTGGEGGPGNPECEAGIRRLGAAGVVSDPCGRSGAYGLAFFIRETVFAHHPLKFWQWQSIDGSCRTSRAARRDD